MDKKMLNSSKETNILSTLTISDIFHHHVIETKVNIFGIILIIFKYNSELYRAVMFPLQSSYIQNELHCCHHLVKNRKGNELSNHLFQF